MNKHNSSPPKMAQWILKKITFRFDNYAILGDFEEEYIERLSQNGKINAIFWYWILILISLPSFIKDSLNWKLSMLKNYFITSFRYLRKNIGYSFINIFGLALGLSLSIIIIVFIVLQSTLIVF